MKKEKKDLLNWRTHWLDAIRYDYMANKALDEAAKYLVAKKGFNHMAISMFSARLDKDKYSILTFNGEGLDAQLSLYEAENMTKEEIQERLNEEMNDYSYLFLMEKV